jgi:hypothetical protein
MKYISISPYIKIVYPHLFQTRHLIYVCFQRRFNDLAFQFVDYERI